MSIDYSKYQPEYEENVSNWLLSFADFISLILAFFILIYSFSEPSPGKYNQVKNAFASTKQQSPVSQTGVSTMPLTDYTPNRAATDYILKLVQNNIQSSGIADYKVTAQGQSIIVAFDHSAIEDYTAKNASARNFFKSFAQTSANLKNQLELYSNSSDIQARKSDVKALSGIFKRNGYLSEIFEFYSGSFPNISDKVELNNNMVAVVIRPYDAN